MDARTFWNERFSQPGYAYGTEPNAFLRSAITHLPKAGRVLCLGEGEGRNAVFLARQGYEVSAIDLSAAGRDKALALAAANEVSIDYTVTNVNDYDFGIDRWDAIVSIFAHTDAQTRQRVYRHTLAALKPGGLFIIESYHPRQLQYTTGGPKDITWLVALDDLRHYFPDQQILHQSEAERDVTEGSAHTGKAFVTQFIFKKMAT